MSRCSSLQKETERAKHKCKAFYVKTCHPFLFNYTLHTMVFGHTLWKNWKVIAQRKLHVVKRLIEGSGNVTFGSIFRSCWGTWAGEWSEGATGGEVDFSHAFTRQSVWRHLYYQTISISHSRHVQLQHKQPSGHHYSRLDGEDVFEPLLLLDQLTWHWLKSSRGKCVLEGFSYSLHV